MFQILQCRQCLLDDVVGRDTTQGRHQCDTAGVALELRVIQALPGRSGGVSVEERHRHSFVVGDETTRIEARNARYAGGGVVVRDDVGPGTEVYGVVVAVSSGPGSEVSDFSDFFSICDI